MTSSQVQRRRKPTSRDVAALAGVAQSTVSAAMNGTRAVAPETKRRIEEAMRELGYQPNAVARTLRTAQTRVIALAIKLGPESDAVETVPYIQAVVDEARSHDFDVVLSTASEGPEGLRRLIGRSICDAVLLMDIRRRDERVATAAELHQPVVLVGRPDDPMGLDVVDNDARKAAEFLVDDLAETGHEHLLLMSEPASPTEPLRAFSEFYEGAVERARLRGLTVDFLTPAGTLWREVWPLTAQIAEHSGRKLGLIARSPRAAEWCLRLVAETGLSVGVDASVAALCSDDVAESLDPPVSNVSPMAREVSRRAMSVLFERLAGDERPAQIELVGPPGITRRRSTVRFDLL